MIDGIETGNLIVVVRSIPSPKNRAGIKSLLLRDILARLTSAGIDLGGVSAMLFRQDVVQKFDDSLA